MVSVEFVNNFIAEIALDISLVNVVLTFMSPKNKKYIIPVIILGLAIFPFYGLRILSFSHTLSLLFFVAYSGVGVYFLSKIIANNARHSSENDSVDVTKTKYGYEKSIPILDNYIPLFYAVTLSIVALIPLGIWESKIKIPLVVSIIILTTILMGVYYFNKGCNDKVRRLDTTLSTLFLMALISAISLFFVSFFYLSQFSSNQSTIIVGVALIPVIPLMILSEVVLKKVRGAFLTTRESYNVFAKHYKIFVFGALIIVLMLSDLPLVIEMLVSENLDLMIYWTIGFTFFIANFATILLKNLYWFKEEFQQSK